MGDTLDIRLTVSNKSVGHLVYWTSGLALSAASRLLYLITDLSAAFHVGIFFLFCVFGMETGKAGASCPYKE